MTDKEIFEKVIDKAKNNGFPAPLERNWVLLLATYPMIIFSHDFAKAFWGCNNDPICSYYDGGGNRLEEWQYHLQQMVVEPQPLKYLEQFLE